MCVLSIEWNKTLHYLPVAIKYFLLSDPRFPVDHKVTLHFEKSAQIIDTRSFVFQSPLVKIEPINAVAKYDSLENFDDGKFKK